MNQNDKQFKIKYRYWKNRPLKEACFYCQKRFQTKKEKYAHEKGCQSTLDFETKFE